MGFIVRYVACVCVILRGCSFNWTLVLVNEIRVVCYVCSVLTLWFAVLKSDLCLFLGLLCGVGICAYIPVG